MELNKIFKSFILGLILAIISYVALSFVGGYKVETTMYVNDKYLKEMNEDAKYILSSLNYLDYLRDNSKLVKNIFKQTDEYTCLLYTSPSPRDRG